MTGQIVPANSNQIPPPEEPGSTAGCAAADLTPASATEDQIALIQRGACTFEEKAANAQAAGYGGTAGVAYDECYHQACDTVDNLNTKSLGEMGDAAAHVALTLARSRSGFFEDGSRVGKKGVRVKAKTGADAVK